MKFIKFVRQGRSQDWLRNIFFIVLPLLFQSSHCQYYSDACRSIQGKLGTCVPLATCPLFLGWLKQRPVVKRNLRLLVDFTCFFDNKNPKVCCPNENFYVQDDPVGFRLGTPNRRAIANSNNNRNKLVFPTPSIVFPGREEVSTKATPSSDSSEDIVLGQRGEIPRHREHTPLSFPNDSHFPTSHHLDRGKSVWTGMKNSKPVEPRERKDLRFHPNFRLIPKLHECSNAVKLNSPLGTYGVYPWIALIGTKRRRSLDFDHVCAGAIINNRYIVTSAHSLTKIKHIKGKYVRLAEYDLETLIDEGSEFLPQSRREDYPIEKLTIHPDYDPTTGANDIALVRIDKQLALNTTFIRPVCLPFLNEYEIDLKSNRLDLNNLDGRPTWVAGWSRHSWDGYSSGLKSTVLQDAVVEITSHDRCRQEYPHLTTFNSRSQICVGGKDRKNSCVPDSGGPLLALLKVPGRVHGFSEPKFFMLGLLSQGPTGRMCQSNDDEEGRMLPTSVYTKLTHNYLTWILNNMQE